MWQDACISIASVVLAMAVPPIIYEGWLRKEGITPLTTSIPTAVALLSLSVTYFTLSLYWSSLLTLISALLWLTITLQRIYYANN